MKLNNFKNTLIYIMLNYPYFRIIILIFNFSLYFFKQSLFKKQGMFDAKHHNGTEINSSK